LLKAFSRSDGRGEMALSLSKGKHEEGKIPAWFYILRLKSGSLYIGAMTDLEKRYKEHCLGVACRSTTIDPPVALIYSEEFEMFRNARRREAQVKRWSRAKKEALVSSDMASLRNLAQSRKE
jgi:putative endonuclease